MRKIKLSTPLMIAVIILASQSLYSASVQSKSGSVSIKSNKSSYVQAIPGMTVKSSDYIKTARNAYCKVKLDTGTVITVQQDSNIQLSDIESQAASMSLRSGSLVAKVQKLQGGSFEVNTPSAQAGVRGTTFAVETDENGTRISVNEGIVVVKANIDFTAYPTDTVKILESYFKSKAYEVSKDESVFIQNAKIEKANSFFKDNRERIVAGLKKEMTNVQIEETLYNLGFDKVTTNFTIEKKKITLFNDNDTSLELKMDDTKTITFNPFEAMIKEWSVETGTSLVYSSVYTKELIITQADKTKIYAIDPADGKIKWNLDTNGNIDSLALVTDKYVFISVTTNEKVLCINKATGEIVWEKRLGAVIQESSFAFKDGYVYFGASNKNLYSVEAATGVVKWQYETGSTISCTPQLMDDKVLIGSNDGILYAVNQNTGKEVWKTQPFKDRIVHAKPHVYESNNGKIAVINSFGAEGEIKAFNDLGKEIWKLALNDLIGSIPIRAGNYYIVLTRSGKLVVIDVLKGQIAFSKANNFTESYISMDSEGKYIIINKKDGTVYFYSTANWELVKELKLEASLGGHVFYENGKIIATTEKAEVFLKASKIN